MTREDLIELLGNMIEQEMEDCNKVCKEDEYKAYLRKHDNDVALRTIVKVWHEAARYFESEVIR
jgi:hypothetical protein